MKIEKLSGALLFLAIAGALTACDENSWNDKLPGYEEIEDQPFENKQSIEYTLTEADYKAIASNSTNVALAGENKDALSAVGTKLAFSPTIPAADYVPAFLASTGFPYFTLTDGSSVRLTYNVTADPAPEALAAQGAQTYTVSAANYEEDVWGSDDFVTAFAPSCPASKFIPSLLSDYVDPAKQPYCVVTYNQTATEPVFGTPDTPVEPVGPVEVFAETFTEDLGDFTIENKVMDEPLTYVWSWGGANYGAKASAFTAGESYPSEAWLISPEIDLTGISQTEMVFEHVVNKFPDLEFAKANCTLWGRKAGGEWEQITIPEYTDNTSWTFGTSGTISLAKFEGAKMQFAFKYVSETGKSGTWEVKNLVINGVAGAAKAAAKLDVPYQTLNAVYFYNGSEWVVPANFVVLNPDTYAEMGQTYKNLSNAEPYLSTYLNRNYPYAAEGDVRYVLWLHYASGATNYDCSEYVHNGTEWAPAATVTTETNQFVKNAGKWMYDPNVTITLPAGRNVEISTLYFQACVDWVYENICVPLGDTSIKSGKFYVSSYGNNEYYSGTSAYQGNLDLRPDKALEQYAAGYEGMSNDEIVALEKKRFMEEVMPGALSKLHPDAKPIDGLEVLYTINFAVYTGSTTEYSAVFRVVAPGKFEPVSCTWDSAE